MATAMATMMPRMTMYSVIPWPFLFSTSFMVSSSPLSLRRARQWRSGGLESLLPCDQKERRERRKHGGIAHPVPMHPAEIKPEGEPEGADRRDIKEDRD